MSILFCCSILQGVLLVYDITNARSFNQLQYWLKAMNTVYMYSMILSMINLICNILYSICKNKNIITKLKCSLHTCNKAEVIK